MTPCLVPVQLGCCPADGSRCRLCAPTPPPTPDLVSGLVHHYATERRRPGQALEVAFFGGAPPSDALLDAIGDLPFRVRVRPDLLSRRRAEALAARGMVHVELDALSFDDALVRGVDRRHRAAGVHGMREGLTALGLTVGVILAVGLPGGSHEGSLADARSAAPFASARLHPVLVLRGAGLHRAHLDGTYAPLTLPQAVTTCRAMVEILEAAGVHVLRVGQNPGADGLGQALAGPRHSSLRELVEARRALDVLTRLASPLSPGSRAVIRCAPEDETRTRGPFNQHVRALRAQHGLTALTVCPDPTLRRGQWRVEEQG